MTKEVTVCGGPKCCTKITTKDDGSVVIGEIHTGKEVLIPKEDWIKIKDKIMVGEL